MLSVRDAGAPIRLRTGVFFPAADQKSANPAELTVERLPTAGLGYYIVQFTGPVQEAWKERVTKAGGTIFDYIPDFAFVVRMDDAAHTAVTALPEVAWVGPFQPAYKISPDFAGRKGMLDLVIQTFPDTALTDLSGQMAPSGARVADASVSEAGGLLRVQADAAQLEALAKIPGVRWIEPFYERVLFNDAARGNAIMGAETAWTTLGLYGQGQIVAVADTGLDTGSLGTLHQDFGGNPTGCSGTNRVVATYALGRNNNWSDSCRSGSVNAGGHGTHVSGSVLGNGCRSGSTGPSSYANSYAGLAPQAGLVMQSVMDSTCGLGGLPTDLNTLFSQARSAGARIHTNSWGSAVAGQYTTDSRNTDLFTWNNKDATILFAAGNAGIDANSDGFIDPDSIGAPATAKNTITVGASENNRLTGGYNPGGTCSTWGGCWSSRYPAEPIKSDRLSDNAGGIVAFSSRGPTDDGRIKPDVVAPGSNILSTKSQATYVSGGWGAGPNLYYQYLGGTSMATPLTAGAMALIRQFYTDIKSITPSGALLKATVINSATDLYPGQYANPLEHNPRLPNFAQGWGRVNVANATDNTHVWQDIADAGGLTTGGSQSYAYETCSASTFKVTLVWTDYPGATLAAKELVNDLDLVITAPDGATTYRGNVFSNGWSTTGGSADRTNNVESVYLQASAAGVWTITISGYNVPNGSSGKQGYALVVDRPGFTGCNDFTVNATPAALNVCAPDDAAFSVNVGKLGGFSGVVTLGASDNPDGTTASFSANPVTPPGNSMLTIGNTGAAAAGSYNITVTGTAGALSRTNTVRLDLSTAPPAAPVLVAPAYGVTGVPTTPILSWNAAAGATAYTLEVATDPVFVNIVHTASGLTATSYTLPAALSTGTTYFWHVWAENACGSRTDPLPLHYGRDLRRLCGRHDGKCASERGLRGGRGRLDTQRHGGHLGDLGNRSPRRGRCLPRQYPSHALGSAVGLAGCGRACGPVTGVAALLEPAGDGVARDRLLRRRHPGGHYRWRHDLDAGRHERAPDGSVQWPGFRRLEQPDGEPGRLVRQPAGLAEQHRRPERLYRSDDRAGFPGRHRYRRLARGLEPRRCDGAVVPAVCRAGRAGRADDRPRERQPGAVGVGRGGGRGVLRGVVVER